MCVCVCVTVTVCLRMCVSVCVCMCVCVWLNCHIGLLSLNFVYVIFFLLDYFFVCDVSEFCAYLYSSVIMFILD